MNDFGFAYFQHFSLSQYAGTTSAYYLHTLEDRAQMDYVILSNDQAIFDPAFTPAIVDVVFERGQAGVVRTDRNGHRW